MPIEVKVPMLPESIADATVAKWYKQPGDRIKRDENLVDLETDKVMLEVPAPNDGILQEIIAREGSTVKENQVLATIETNGAPVQVAKEGKQVTAEISEKRAQEGKEQLAPAADLSPTVRRLIAEHNLNPSDIKGSGKGERISKEDVMSYLQSKQPQERAVVSQAGERPEKRVPMSRLRAKIARTFSGRSTQCSNADNIQ